MNGTATVEPEVLDKDIKKQLDKEIQPYRNTLTKLEEDGRKPITNDAEEMAALVYIAQAKRDYAEMEEIRDRLVRPHNTYVRTVNAAFKAEMDRYDLGWRKRDQERNDYLTEKQRIIDEKNRKAIAEAEEANRVKEAKAEAERQEAKRLKEEAERLEQEEINREYQEEMDRLAAEKKIRDEEEAVREAKRKGDEAAAAAAQKLVDDAKREEEERARKAEEERLAAIEEKAKLEKATIKQAAKVDIAESKTAVPVAPTIQVNDSVGSRTLDNGAQVGTRQVDDWRFDNGLQVYKDPLTRKKYEELYADDSRLANVDIPKSCLLVDLAKLGKIVKAGVPVKGCTMFKRSATTADRK